MGRRSAIAVLRRHQGAGAHRFVPATGDHAVDAIPEEIGCIGLARAAASSRLRSGSGLLDAAGRAPGKLADNPEDPRTSRFNDGRVDPAGRFLAGTIDEPKAGGRLTSTARTGGPCGPRRRAADLERRRLLPGRAHALPLRHPPLHGLALRLRSADGRGKDKTLFIRLQPSERDRGRPDGAAVDAEGCYWTALFEGGRIQRYAPDGRLARRVSRPGPVPDHGRLRRRRPEDALSSPPPVRAARRRSSSFPIRAACSPCGSTYRGCPKPVSILRLRPRCDGIRLHDRSILLSSGPFRRHHGWRVGIGEEIVRAFAVGCAIPGGAIRRALTSGSRKGRLCMLPSKG